MLLAPSTRWLARCILLAAKLSTMRAQTAHVRRLNAFGKRNGAQTLYLLAAYALNERDYET